MEDVEQTEFNQFQAAMRYVIATLDYDLHKALEDPEDEEGPSYDSVTTDFINHYLGLQS